MRLFGARHAAGTCRRAPPAPPPCRMHLLGCAHPSNVQGWQQGVAILAVWRSCCVVSTRALRSCMAWRRAWRAHQAPVLMAVSPSSSRDVATIRMRSTFTMAAHTPPRLTAAWGVENTRKLPVVGVSLSKDFRNPPNQPPSHIANCSYGATGHAVTPSCVLSYEVVMQEPLPRQSAARSGASLARASHAPQYHGVDHGAAAKGSLHLA